ncbi:hypothetical protein BVRB_029370 [Beta vulgaris subsp. vulgaris]|uniref:Uncharacterized protein n=1 Tax=Beta vulgaris subsp. vulgaris TaxID=3555 RepID=A0A0J8AY45_BETVV|nr:hypothetical protein BVRB_029370 [Beta vulgaris subsp. vulgaris]
MILENAASDNISGFLSFALATDNDRRFLNMPGLRMGNNVILGHQFKDKLSICEQFFARAANPQSVNRSQESKVRRFREVHAFASVSTCSSVRHVQPSNQTSSKHGQNLATADMVSAVNRPGSRLHRNDSSEDVLLKSKLISSWVEGIQSKSMSTCLTCFQA